MKTLFDPAQPRPQRIHPNTLAAFGTLDGATRDDEIRRALRRLGRPATDREILTACDRSDMNYVRPTITRLVQDGALREAGDTVCVVTGHRVRTVWFAGEA